MAAILCLHCTQTWIAHFVSVMPQRGIGVSQAQQPTGRCAGLTPMPGSISCYYSIDTITANPMPNVASLPLIVATRHVSLTYLATCGCVVEGVSRGPSGEGQ